MPWYTNLIALLFQTIVLGNGQRWRGDDEPQIVVIPRHGSKHNGNSEDYDSTGDDVSLRARDSGHCERFTSGLHSCRACTPSLAWYTRSLPGSRPVPSDGCARAGASKVQKTSSGRCRPAGRGGAGTGRSVRALSAYRLRVISEHRTGGGGIPFRLCYNVFYFFSLVPSNSNGTPRPKTERRVSAA